MQAKQVSAWEQEWRMPQGFLLIFGLGLLYALPIMLDGRYYLDDLSRAMNGLTQWEKDGRPLASILSSLISFSWPSFSGPALQDISPLPQALAIVALAYSAARLAGRLFPQGVGLLQALVVFPVIASPFMLQNLSYKYDSFTMSLAIALALLAGISRGWKTGALLVLALMLYQTAFNVFIGTATLVWLAAAAQGEADDSGFLAQLGWGLAALVAYTLGMKALGGFSGDYASTHTQLVGLSAEGVASVQNNLGFALYFVLQVINDAPLLAIGAAVAIFGFGAVLARRAENGLALRFVLALVIICMAVAGLLLVLQFPAMRPRSLMGFSMLLVFAAYCAHGLLERWPQLRIMALVLSTAWFFVLANTYANAARDETRFDAALTQDLIHDLLKAGFRPGEQLAFDGVQPLSPVAENALRMKTIARILQPNMNGNSEWGFRQLEFFGLPTTPIMDATDESVKTFCAGASSVSTPHYQIYLYDSTALVAFPKGVCFKS